MSGAGLWAAVVGVELLVLLCGVLAIAWWRHQRLRLRDRQAVQSLVAKLRKGRPEREAAIRSFLSERFGLADQALEGAAVPIAKEELRLYQTFANLYLTRDAGAVAGFDLALEAAVAPYWQLQGGAAAEVAAEVEPADNPELEHLRDENCRLSEELQITMNTMSRMLAEYSGMFRASADAVAAQAAAPPRAQSATEETEVSGATEDSAAEAIAEPPEVDIAEPPDDPADLDSAPAAERDTAKTAAVDQVLAEATGDAQRHLAELQGMLDDIDESNADSELVRATPPDGSKVAG